MAATCRPYGGQRLWCVLELAPEGTSAAQLAELIETEVLLLGGDTPPADTAVLVVRVPLGPVDADA